MIRNVVFCVFCSFWALPAFAQSNDPVCSSEISFTNVKTVVNPTSVLNLNLFSAVSNPMTCMTAQVFLTATFYDSDDNVICSGTLNLMDQSTNIMSTNLEIRLLNVLEFVRVLNPRRPPAKRLLCNNLDGNAEVGGTQIASAATLKLLATILPQHGGIASTEARMTLNGR